MYIYEKMNNGAYILHYSFFYCVTCYTPQGKKIRALPLNLTNKTDTRQPRDFVSLVARKSQRVIVVWMVLFPKGCAKHKTSRPPFYSHNGETKRGGMRFPASPPDVRCGISQPRWSCRRGFPTCPRRRPPDASYLCQPIRQD